MIAEALAFHMGSNGNPNIHEVKGAFKYLESTGQLKFERIGIVNAHDSIAFDSALSVSLDDKFSEPPFVEKLPEIRQVAQRSVGSTLYHVTSLVDPKEWNPDYFKDNYNVTFLWM